ncbi:MAG: LPS translocon maturation chaperone LptM [Casimicrobium sp.]
MKTIFTRLVLFTSLLVCALALSACGNKGPLVPPKAIATLTLPTGG